MHLIASIHLLSFLVFSFSNGQLDLEDPPAATERGDLDDILPIDERRLDWILPPFPPPLEQDIGRGASSASASPPEAPPEVAAPPQPLAQPKPTSAPPPAAIAPNLIPNIPQLLGDGEDLTVQETRQQNQN